MPIRRTDLTRVQKLAHATNNALGAARGQCEMVQIEAAGNLRLERRMNIAIGSIEEAAKLLRQIVQEGLEPTESSG